MNVDGHQIHKTRARQFLTIRSTRMRSTSLIITISASVLVAICYGQSSLKADLDELEAMVPKKEIETLTKGYATHDLQFWKLAIYIESSHFKELWKDILSQEKVIAFITYGEDNGVGIIEDINKIASTLKLPKYPVKSKFLMRIHSFILNFQP